MQYKAGAQPHGTGISTVYTYGNVGSRTFTDDYDNNRLQALFKKIVKYLYSMS